MHDFTGRRVLVTGSTRGLGNATARQFLACGATVVFHGRSSDAAADAVRMLPHDLRNRCESYGADLLSRAETDALATCVGPIDVLVNCAGIYEVSAIGQADVSHWDRTVEVNLTAPWRLSRALVPALRDRKGVIVNVASDAAFLGYRFAAAYCASKGAFVGLTRALATELAPFVRVVCVCPGPIDTDMMRLSASTAGTGTDNAAQWAAYTMLGRVASAEEVAPAVLFAASGECSYQTGSAILVDGGATAGRRLAPF